MGLHTALAELTALLAPPNCATCRAPLLDAQQVLCPDCRRALPWLRGPLCRRCALPLPCRPCPAGGAAFDAAWAPLAYAGSAREAVAALKFRGALVLADAMAAQIAANLPGYLGGGDALVPVPLPARRSRARGFNQAERLAHALGRRLGLPVMVGLVRRGEARQLGARRGDRRAPGRLGISLRPGATPPERIILVDDVHTTGATLDACAAALRLGGARKVVALTYARTLAG